MSDFNVNFLASLKTGFIDKNLPSFQEYHPEFLVNDKELGKRVLTSIKRELNDCDEFWFSVAFITTSGLAVLQTLFKELEDRGIRGRILVSQYLNFTQPEALRKLLSLSHIETRISVSGNFHSKGYLFKKENYYNLIVGSSNLTASALCSNKEWNLKISAISGSSIIGHALNEFQTAFDQAVVVDEKYIDRYSAIYSKYRAKSIENARALNSMLPVDISPNKMQTEALSSLKNLRSEGKRKSLLISATGTGKTYLSAFDIKQCKAKRVLFVVHRFNIAEKTMKDYKSIFGDSKSMGLYSGSNRDLDADFIFSTVQTISRDEHLKMFSPSSFDYIVIDETHRAGASSYQRLLNYFEPSFLLGMTATPERMDGLDVFKLFDYNIAYEIRLHAALEQEMLSPFHYYGLTDISVAGEFIDEKSVFNRLVADERVDRIIEQVKYYGCDDGVIKGLVFCSKVQESDELSAKFNERGYRTVSLSGATNEKDREAAIKRLESSDMSQKLDYIFTVDIFNEGVDIPRVNQVVMLRPTESSIVFIQQLGRGLRKLENKEYLTVIDFIGNYEKNYLVPVALYGDTSYNKDRLRSLVAGGNNFIPGTSSINFDRITQDKIFESINTANLQKKSDLVKDYRLLKYKIGRVPMMMDFIKYAARDPFLYVAYSKSYYNFVVDVDKEVETSLSSIQMKMLELFSREINNAKRVEESIILRELLENEELKISCLKKIISDEYGYDVEDVTIDSCVGNLNFAFVTEKVNKKLISCGEANNLAIVRYENDVISLDSNLSDALSCSVFKSFLSDSIECAISMFANDYVPSRFNDGFVLYRKYSRKDAFRVLNWKQNPVAQNVGGYMLSADKSNCPIFVNYHKEENISSTTKYEDGFINNSEFSWMSKSNRTLNSPDVMAIKNYRSGLRLPLFIKKSNDEGGDFYYMGDMIPKDDSFVQTSMLTDKGKSVSVVKIDFTLNHSVEDGLYSYLVCG